MILPIIALLVGLSCFFTALAMYRKAVIDYAVAAVLWLVCAAGSFVMEVPYQVASSTENSVITGVQKFASAEGAVSWIFLLLAVVMVFHMMYLLFGGRTKR